MSVSTGTLIILKSLTMYRINPFVHVFERNNALFNALTLKTIYMSDDIYCNLLLDVDETLLKDEFIVPSDFNSLEYFNRQCPHQKDRDISVAYFLLTSICNFRCKYCFVETRIEKQQNTIMTEDIAEKGLQLLMRNINLEKELSIVFYGGEPLINFKVIKYIVNRTKELGIIAKFIIVSNGSICTQEIIDFMRENQFEIGISLDGLQDTNDTMRIDEANKGTFSKIESTISSLVDNGLRTSISCTISKHNMDFPEEIISVLEKYQIKGFGYNTPTDNENVFFSTDEKKAMVANLMKAEDIIFDKRIIEDRIINRRMKAFVEKRKWIKDCAGYGHQIAITPNGQVGVCHGLWPDEINQKDQTYYDLTVDYEGRIIDHPSWKEWFMRTPFNMPQCWNCEAISLCGGGCAKNSFIRSGTIWEVDEDICILMKEVTPWVIWKYYDVKVKPHFNKA